MPAVDGDRFGSRAADYAHHRADFPAATVDRLVGLGVGRPGQRLLDVGCGTGTLARQFAARGCRVTGLDVDARMLEAAVEQATADGVEVEWTEAPAEETGLPAGSFDVVVAAQCWHWFDGASAAVEVRRLLVPGGLLAIGNFDWLPLPGTVSGETEALIQSHHPTWGLGGIREPLPEAIEHAERAGFTVFETWIDDIDVPYLADSWRRRIGASAAIVNLEPAAAEAFDRELAALLADRFPGDEVEAPHRVSVLVARAPG
jgi:SAM-dependent methyltransferase